MGERGIWKKEGIKRGIGESVENKITDFKFVKQLEKLFFTFK